MVIEACPIRFVDALEAYAAGQDRARHGICYVFWFFTSRPRSWSMQEFHDRATRYGHHPYQWESEAIAIAHLGAEYVAHFLHQRGYDSWESYQQAIAPPDPKIAGITVVAPLPDDEDDYLCA